MTVLIPPTPENIAKQKRKLAKWLREYEAVYGERDRQATANFHDRLDREKRKYDLATHPCQRIEAWEAKLRIECRRVPTRWYHPRDQRRRSRAILDVPTEVINIRMMG